MGLRALISRLRHLRRDEGAVAAVEFALILPFLLALYVGSIEASQLITVDRRITTIAGTVGDLVARSDGTITQSQLTDYFRAAEGIILPFSTTGLKQVVTSVYVNAAGVTSVQWSQPYNGGTAYVVGRPYTLPVEITNISRNAYVIVSETSYSYLPLLGIVFKTSVPLYRQNFHMPRFGAAINLS